MFWSDSRAKALWENPGKAIWNVQPLEKFWPGVLQHSWDCRFPTWLQPNSFPSWQGVTWQHHPVWGLCQGSKVSAMISVYLADKTRPFYKGLPRHTSSQPWPPKVWCPTCLRGTWARLRLLWPRGLVQGNNKVNLLFPVYIFISVPNRPKVTRTRHVRRLLTRCLRRWICQ